MIASVLCEYVCAYNYVESELFQFFSSLFRLSYSHLHVLHYKDLGP